MLKDNLHIQDNIFSHAFSSSWWNKPSNFEWVRNLNSNTIILTDNHLHLVDNIKGKKVIGWLIESPAVTPKAYNYIKYNYKKFHKIYTFKKDLLGISDKFEFIPSGNCWILPKDRKVYQKNKNISIIASNKRFTKAQQLRHTIIKKYKNIDTYGNGYKHIENKILGLKDYRYSVVIENIKEDFYFTEKIIDCFLTGTIPIYYGCPSIGDFFDIDGILTFNDEKEFNDIINLIDEDFYKNKIKSINNNYNKSLKYVIADDILYEKIKYD